MVMLAPNMQGQKTTIRLDYGQQLGQNWEVMKSQSFRPGWVVTDHFIKSLQLPPISLSPRTLQMQQMSPPKIKFTD